MNKSSLLRIAIGSVGLFAILAGLLQMQQGFSSFEPGFSYEESEGRRMDQGAREGSAGRPVFASQQEGMATGSTKTHDVIDQSKSMTAMTFTVPEGWQTESNLQWQNTLARCAVHFKATDPASGAVMQTYPTQTFQWADGPMTRSLQQYNTVRYVKPLAPEQALRQLYVEPQRGRMQDFRIVESRLAPEYFEEVGVQREGQSEIAMIRVSYTENGRPFEEQFYGNISSMSTRTQGVMGTDETGIWSVSGVHSFKAPQGQLGAMRPTLLAIGKSVSVNPQWSKSVQDDNEAISRQFYANQKGIADRSRIISQNSNAAFNRISSNYWDQQASNDRMNQSYWDRQASQDRQAHNFINAIREERDATNPYTGEVGQISHHYQNNWINSSNQVIQTNDSYYNPNQSAYGDWTKIDE